MPPSAGFVNLKGEYLTDYPVLMADSLMAIAPLIVAFLIFHDAVDPGIATTDSKG